jgi:hypothetical protein
METPEEAGYFLRCPGRLTSYLRRCRWAVKTSGQNCTFVLLYSWTVVIGGGIFVLKLCGTHFEAIVDPARKLIFTYFVYRNGNVFQNHFIMKAGKISDQKCKAEAPSSV